MIQRFFILVCLLFTALASTSPALALGDQIGVSAAVSQQRLVYIQNGQIVKIEGNVGGNFAPTFIDVSSNQLVTPSQQIRDQYLRLFYRFGNFAAGQIYYPPVISTPSNDPFKSSLSKLEFD